MAERLEVAGQPVGIFGGGGGGLDEFDACQYGLLLGNGIEFSLALLVVEIVLGVEVCDLARGYAYDVS